MINKLYLVLSLILYSISVLIYNYKYNWLRIMGQFILIIVGIVGVFINISIDKPLTMYVGFSFHFLLTLIGTDLILLEFKVIEPNSSLERDVAINMLQINFFIYILSLIYDAIF